MNQGQIQAICFWSLPLGQPFCTTLLLCSFSWGRWGGGVLKQGGKENSAMIMALSVRRDSIHCFLDPECSHGLWSRTSSPLRKGTAWDALSGQCSCRIRAHCQSSWDARKGIHSRARPGIAPTTATVSFFKRIFFNCVKFTQHKIDHLNHFQVYSSVTLSTFTLLCN